MLPARPRRSLPHAQVAPGRSASVSEAQQLLLPLVLAFALAMMMAWPAQVRAQGAAVTASSSGTHTVRPGETLWSLAARYYGNGHKWRELAALNGLSEGGERGVAVGQVLRLPAELPPLAAARAAMAEAPPTSTPSVAVTPAGGDKPREAAPAVEVRAVAAEPAPAPAAAEPAPAPIAAPAEAPAAEAPAAERAVRIGLVKPTELSAARGRDNTTIFIGPAPFDADTMQGTIWLNGNESFVAPAGRRVGEFQAAPVPVEAASWKESGRIVARAQATGGRVAGAVQRMQQRDLVEVVLPSGLEPTPGMQLVAVAQGADLGRGARLAIPTGILTVEAPRNGVTVARVTRIYGVIEQGQAMLPYVEAPAAPVAGDVPALETTVRWITDAPLLPSLQAYLVLSPAEQGIEPGDRFELVSSGASGTRVAVARVVRVTSAGATAIVTQQDQPAIRVGMTARRIGRAP